MLARWIGGLIVYEAFAATFDRRERLLPAVGL
jgi:hypothetical protein